MTDSFYSKIPSDCLHSSDYSTDVQKWQNFSMVWRNQSFYFYDFVCKKIRYDWTKEQCESMEARLVLALGIFGFFGALMSVLVFSRRPFVATDVYLYRAVGVVECVHMAVMAFMHATSFFDCHSNYVCTLFSAHIYMTVTNLCAEAVEFIVVFLCIERTIACLTPQHFHKIHRIGAYRIAAILALVTSLPLNIIHAFDMTVEYEYEEPEDQAEAGNLKIVRYNESPSWFGSTPFYERMMDAQLVRFCLVAPIIVVATAGSIIGLRQAVGRKKRLRGDHNFRGGSRKLLATTQKQSVEAVVSNEGMDRPVGAQHSLSTTSSTAAVAAADRTRKEIKQMIDLCCLQLCLAVPIVINYLLCMSERAAKWNIDIPDRAKIYQMAFEMPDYDHACAMIKRATVLEHLRFAISLTHMLAHGLHFYLYISFSAKFRQTLVDWLSGNGKLGVWTSSVRKSFRQFSQRGLANRESQGFGDGVTGPEYDPVPTNSISAAAYMSVAKGEGSRL